MNDLKLTRVARDNEITTANVGTSQLSSSSNINKSETENLAFISTTDMTYNQRQEEGYTLRRAVNLLEQAKAYSEALEAELLDFKNKLEHPPTLIKKLKVPGTNITVGIEFEIINGRTDVTIPLNEGFAVNYTIVQLLHQLIATPEQMQSIDFSDVEIDIETVNAKLIEMQLTLD